MGITLFEHNKTAYDAALSMLAETGKAAVVHPTGTGKSFIGFKLCEEHPDKTICWLSPSEYIFKTQLENLIKTSDGYEPQNIRFFTYAKLMLMEDDELEEIKPDYIVLDEFHRCGAEMWGQGVYRLLECCPETPMLGLSATNIRYLDNQRDMADELFDGNIASEMTLGEAIVRGILNPPKYILSIFSYQNDLEKYEARVRSTKNKTLRETAEKHLEALRRALEKADGVDEIFRKHMSDSSGKYIVFCANYEHMKEMIEKAPEWFSKVDTNPHIYSVYSENPGASSDFMAFKADNSAHLKLLFCIDMLNEGIHVDDISGVVLLRPTVSPIIYKQQIGRALSANKKKNAVIFDIVLNIENLYSFGALEEEMQLAMNYYRLQGMEGKIVNEHFKVIDEVRDCRELFQKLNDSLTVSWELMYQKAKDYYEEKGNLEIPKRYVTEEGFQLGSWIYTQRRVYSSKTSGILTRHQIEKLNKIGMRWEDAKDFNWEKNFDEARRYYEKHGNLLVNTKDGTVEDVALGRWIAQLRVHRKKYEQSTYLTLERIQALENIGMIWDVPDYLWEQNYHSARQYYCEYGNLDVPSGYVDENGIRLGAWISSMRSLRKRKGRRAELTVERIAKLDDIGMVWKSKSDIAWEKSYAAVCEYRRKYGDLDIPAAYVTKEGEHIGRWIRHQREAYPSGLREDRKKKLDDIGMIWEFEDPWESKFQLVQQYYDKNGDVNMPGDYVVNGVWLARWLNEQIARLNGKVVGKNGTAKLLTAEQVKRLESLGIRRNVSRNDILWEQQYEEAKAFYLEYGHLTVPKNYIGSNGKNLGTWVMRQRRNRRLGILKEKQIELLDEIGMVWEIHRVQKMCVR